VLVHDMGQNWELVSDALNSIVQLKVLIDYNLHFFLQYQPSKFFLSRNCSLHKSYGHSVKINK
jgi:hypothetical protein